MKIDGRKLADSILRKLKKEVLGLKKRKIFPRLAVVQIGVNESSTSYIRQKILAGRKISVKVDLHQLSNRVSFEKTIQLIRELNSDPKVNGIILQRPIPPQLSAISLTRLVKPLKDVDGFLEKSPYEPPVAETVMFLLGKIYGKKKWKTALKRKKVLLIGRGETGGQPVCRLLQKHKIRFMNVHSKTDNIEEFKKEADIIISCVGKRNILNAKNIKKRAVLIGLGIIKEGKKFYGDYNEKAVRKKTSFYTATPGGTGPLTVAFLMKNLIQAAKEVN